MATRLIESTICGPGLKVDRAAGIIFGVRMLGPLSKNTYGVRDVDATEYTESAHRDAVRLYEGAVSCIDHVNARDSRKERSARDSFGTFRNILMARGKDGPATYGDLHYLRSHDMADKVAEAAERALPCLGLSHDAYAGSERIDKARRRLVIESLKSVNSIDIVLKPATNRSLSESLDVSMADSSYDEVARLLVENEKLRTEMAVRHLCESEGFTPRPYQVAAIAGLRNESDRRTLIAELKRNAKSPTGVRSGFRRTRESDKPSDLSDLSAWLRDRPTEKEVKEFALRIRG